ncbi:MAG: DUF6454 family protein [Limisphaerales bacterium]
MNPGPRIALLVVGWVVSGAGAEPVVDADRRTLAARFQKVASETPWLERPSVPLTFDAHHPQGLVKVGDHFYLSTVEILKRPEIWSPPRDGFDRGVGEGVGHLMRFDSHGSLVADLRLGEGAIYHPGGIDFDGEHLWVPVAQYRPGGHSRIYRVSVPSFEALEVFRFPDHIGAVAYDRRSRVLHGVSWGSRFFYRWRIPEHGPVEDALKNPEDLRRPNPSFYIDYQDCKWLGAGLVVCSGVRTYAKPPGASTAFALGGIEIVDIEALRPVHQVPVEHWSPSGRVLSQNAFWWEPIDRGLRLSFVPDDGRSAVRIFDLRVE